ncbi:MAG: hypothetical protein J6B28_01465 [Eubacterium sp.]|nr:hypothetical protein [Eubacterium sp.]
MLLIFEMVLYILLALLWLAIHVRRRAWNEREQRLAEQEHFFDELADAYGKHHDMREALDECLQKCEARMQELLPFVEGLEYGEIPDFSEKKDTDETNTYLSLLFMLCMTIRTFGDLRKDGVSLFVHNIRYIKESVRMELLRRQEGRYAYMGLSALCLVPFFMCLPIRLWCVSISEGLQRFYSGAYGFSTLLVCFFLSVLCVVCVQELQNPTMPGEKKETFAQRLLKISVIASVIDAKISRHYSKYLKRNEMLKVLQGFGNIREFLVKKILFAVMLSVLVVVVLFGYMAADGWQTLGAIRQEMCFVLTLICFMWLGYYLPDAWVIVLQSRVQQQKIEETLRFETLLLIVMHYQSITVEEILRWMERFSTVFSRALQRAVDDFSYRRTESLHVLKEELAYEPVKKLIDSLMACDDIPVEQAFFDLEGERAYHVEQYKQYAKNSQRERAAVARVVAFLPFVAVLALRLLIPFVLEGLSLMQQ